MTKFMMIDGVSPSRVYLPKLPKPPACIFDFLCQSFDHIQPSQWRERFLANLVLDDKANPISMDTPYEQGRTIYYYRQVSDEVDVPFHHEVLFENDHIIVVDKPPFLVVSPTGDYVKQTLLSRLKHTTQNPDLSPIHRLDKETAGVMMFAKRADTRHLYQAMFAHHEIKKTYHAIAGFMPTQTMPTDVRLHLERGSPFYTMRVNPDKSPNTHTHIRLLQVSGRWAKYELTPTTGKLHQLRVHLNHLGIAIKDDPYYPQVIHRAKDDFTTPLQLLAKQLEFVDPVSGEAWVFCSRRELDLGGQSGVL